MIKEGFETSTCSCGNITFYEFTRDTCQKCTYNCGKLYWEIEKLDGCVIRECVSCGEVISKGNLKSELDISDIPF